MRTFINIFFKKRLKEMDVKVMYLTKAVCHVQKEQKKMVRCIVF